jgi:hypothetical protein
VVKVRPPVENFGERVRGYHQVNRLTFESKNGIVHQTSPVIGMI